MDAIWHFEVSITLFFQALGSWLTLPMKAFTFLGQEEFFLAVVPAIYWCLDAGLGLRLGVMLVATTSLNCWLKLAFQQPRPYWYDRRVAALVGEATFGMPSAHAQTTAAMWGLLAWEGKRASWVVLAVLLALLIGISRIYLGVHFADQVLAGWLVGGILVWGTTRLEKPAARWIGRLALSKLLLLVLLISLAIIAVTLWMSLGGQPVPAEWVSNALAAAPQTTFTPFDPSSMIALAGVWLGMGAGAAWDWRKHGKPAMGGDWTKRGQRYLIGLVGLGVFYFGLKLVLPGTNDLLGETLRYLRYALVGLWVTALAPALFRRARLL